MRRTVALALLTMAAAACRTGQTAGPAGPPDNLPPTTQAGSTPAPSAPLGPPKAVPAPPPPPPPPPSARAR